MLALDRLEQAVRRGERGRDRVRPAGSRGEPGTGDDKQVGDPDRGAAGRAGAFAGGISAGLTILGTAATHPVTAFHHVWLAVVIAGLAACLAVALTAVKPAARR